MKNLFILISLLTLGVSGAQVNLTNGQIHGTSYAASELRAKVEKGESAKDIKGIKGSAYFHKNFIKGKVHTSVLGKILSEGGYKYNGSSGEFELPNGTALLPSDEMFIWFEEAEEYWVYDNQIGWLFMVNPFEIKGETYVAHPTSEYEEAIPAANTKVRDVPAKWHIKIIYYRVTSDDNDKDVFTELTRKERKALKRMFKSKPVKQTAEHEHKPPVYKFNRGGIGNVNHNAPGHVCDETCH